MKSNPFKNFTVYSVAPSKNNPRRSIINSIHAMQADNLEDDAELHGFVSTDPTGQTWGTLGLTHATTEGDYFHDLDGAGVLCAFQFNDRMLPARVRDEQVDKMAADIADREGRKVGRKEYAELREQVEGDLLPKAFIKRSVVYCLFAPSNRLYIFTTSQSKCDKVVTMLVGFFNAAGYPIEVSHLDSDFKRGPIHLMTSMALDLDYEDGGEFYPGSPMVLKNDDDAKSCVRIKDTSAQRTEYLSLIEKNGFQVHELGMAFIEDGYSEARMTFRLNHNFVFKGVVLGDTVVNDDESDGGFHAVAWLVAKEYEKLVNSMVAVLGADDEDEEL